MRWSRSLPADCAAPMTNSAKWRNSIQDPERAGNRIGFIGYWLTSACGPNLPDDAGDGGGRRDGMTEGVGGKMERWKKGESGERRAGILVDRTNERACLSFVV